MMTALHGHPRASDFDGFAFTVGSVLGTRSFKFNPAAGGLITSPTYVDTHWLDGRVHEAQCVKVGFRCGVIDDDHNHRLGTCGWGPSICVPPGIDCQCGFYAYFGGALGQSYAIKSQLAGVIEGHGRCIIGTRGFKAQKARIVALYAPPMVDPLVSGSPVRALGLDADDMWLLRQQYPSTPLYDSFESMLRDFPTDNPVGGR